MVPWPFRNAKYAAAAATSVLPLPTSPCISRFIGNSRCISAIQSRTAFFCAFVGSNGSALQSGVISAGFMTAPVCSLPRRFIKDSPSFRVSSSSSTRRRRASVYSCRVRGKCICLTAVSRGSSPSFSISGCGRLSATVTCCNAVFTFADTMLLESPAVSGYFGMSTFSETSTNSGVLICFRISSPVILP